MPEDKMEDFDRITHNPAVVGGKACVRGMRVTVSMILSEIGADTTADQLMDDFPYLEREDIMQSLRYAAWLAQEREIVLASA